MQKLHRQHADKMWNNILTFHASFAVIKQSRTQSAQNNCAERHFFKVVKTGFSQRRKTLKNALKPLLPKDTTKISYLDKRAEQLDKFQFAELTQQLLNN